MLIDAYGLRHSTDDPRICREFASATLAVAAHRPGAGPAIAAILARDPDCIAARALSGFACLVLARAELVPSARMALDEARSALARRGGGSADERGLVDALALAVAGRFLAAADRLEADCASRPNALFALKLAHSLRFMAGDLPGMLATTSACAATWDAEGPGYGFLMGCHAFGLEEAGRLAQAEDAGRLATRLEPADAWGRHAVAHVMETDGRTGEGVAWIEGTRPSWTRCNNFAYHMAWHLALFRLERGDHEAVLALYDTEVRPDASDDFRDVANAVSLLWRLDQHGVDVGPRWDALRDVALARRQDASLTFASLHTLLALVATGERRAARDGLAALEARAVEPDDQGAVLRAVGLDLARALVDDAPLSPARLATLVARLPRIGGSHAQRDVFLRTLACKAEADGDASGIETVLAARRRFKRDDRFAADISRGAPQPDVRAITVV